MAARREARAHDELLGRARNFTVLLRSGDELHVIGQAGYRTIWADETPKRGEVGIVLAHAHQGKGLVWDVHLALLALGFDELGLETVEWVTSETNEGMRAVLRKMGCEDVGVSEEDGLGFSRKYTLNKRDWAVCKSWLCERVHRSALAKSSAS